MGWKPVEEQQPTAARMLTNGIKRDQLSHAYLLEGQRGTGKKEAAFMLAKAYLCDHRQGADPCETCRDCKRINHSNHPDVVVVKPDGRSIKKEQVANLVKEFAYKGVESQKKVFIIQHAGKMTAQAANSLLKFIEEPQSKQMAVLLTENTHQMLDTVVSRCQLVRFMPLSEEDVKQALIHQGYKSELSTLAAALTNDVGEAAGFCDDDWFARARTIVINLMEELLLRPKYALMVIYEQFAGHFSDTDKSHMALDLILIWYRDVLNLHMDDEHELTFQECEDTIRRQAMNASLYRTTESMSAVMDAKRRLDANVSPLQVFEQLVLRLQGGVKSV